MEKELDTEIIKATQNSLGKHVKRPPLTDKLLKKPPFRFLHDIVTTVLKNTGFFEGLFDPEELISENVKDRDSKISFLNKVISVVGIATGETLSVKSSKIVAGQEPEKTNELLQTLARALDKKISSDDAVKKYKENSNVSPQAQEKESKIQKSLQKSTDNAKKLTSTSSEKLNKNKGGNRDASLTRNEKNYSNSVKQKELNKTNKKYPPPKKSSSQTNTTIKNASSARVKINKTDTDLKDNNVIEKNSNDTENNINTNIKQMKNDKNLDELSRETKDNLEGDVNLQQNQLKPDQSFQENADASYTVADNSLESQDLMEIDNTKLEQEQHSENQTKNELENNIVDNETVKESEFSPQNSLKTEVVKSETQTKNKIDIKNNKTGCADETLKKHKEAEIIHNDESRKPNIRPPSFRPSSSRPGAPRLREKHENVLNNNDNLIIGKVNIIAENTPNDEDEESSIIIMDQQDILKNDPEQLKLSSNQHGHLVQQILDSQKELSQTSAKTEIEWQFGAQKAREALNQEVEQLRFNIQAVSRVANPLGKLFDHIQEDVEVMRQELQQWTKAYEEASKELVKQKIANENSLIPLHSKLKQLNVDIKEKHEKINDLKVIIYKNSSRIEKLLINGNVQ